MKLSIYIKKRLLGDAFTIIIISAVIYLAISALSNNELDNKPSDEMLLSGINLDIELS